MSGIYVHIPFCSRKCIYCDFFSVGERLADWPRFVSALIAELRARVIPFSENSEPGKPGMNDSWRPQTIYIGGGTPSLVPAAEFNRLAAVLTELAPGYSEFTMEVNPDDVTEEKARVWRRAGVNRISMGVQSLVDSELKAIGRRHDAATATAAFNILRNHFDNISLDLMFGLPGQSLSSLRSSLEGVIALNPDHISAYSLMYEERTAITRMRDAGQIEETDEDISVGMFRLINARLREAGFGQYEISNYAHPGFRSRHNSSYWQGHPYVGIGPGAHSYDGDRLRTSNNPDIAAYMRYWADSDGRLPAENEKLSNEELKEEYIMTRLRTREGISLDDYAARFGQSALHKLLRKADKFLAAGTLHHPDNTSIALTDSGIMISDEIIEDLGFGS